MKPIRKGPEPPELTQARHDWAQSGGEPEWGDAPRALLEAIRTSLFAEQGHICCYCGRRLVTNDNHIEHFIPRDGATGDPSLTYCWSNLLACCQANLLKGDPRHCGVAKGNWYDPRLLVSPLDPMCEKRFRFEIDGRIIEAQTTDEGARETIRKLALDGARLRGLRKAAIDGLFEDLSDEMRADEYDMLIRAYQAPDAQGRFDPFCFVLVAVLSALRP